MAFPDSDLTADHLNAATDDPSQARVELYNAILKINAVIDAMSSSATADTGVLRDADGHIKGKQLISEVAIGTPPLSVVSTDKVPNLNADKVDGFDLDQGVKVASSPTFAGVKTDNVILKTKIIEIGDWNMYLSGGGSGSASKIVAHGLLASKIRAISVVIRYDGDGIRTNLEHIDGSFALNGRIHQIFGGDVYLFSKTGGAFDNTGYNDDASYNRGWIEIVYEAY